MLLCASHFSLIHVEPAHCRHQVFIRKLVILNPGATIMSCGYPIMFSNAEENGDDKRPVKLELQKYVLFPSTS